MNVLRGSALAVGIVLLAILELAFFNQLPFFAFHCHVIAFTLLLARGVSLQTRLALGALGGFTLDLYSGLPFGTWLFAIPLALFVPEVIFRQWLSQHSWLAPGVIALTGWSTLQVTRLLASVLGGARVASAVSSAQLQWLFDDLVISVLLASSLVVGGVVLRRLQPVRSLRTYGPA